MEDRIDYAEQYSTPDTPVMQQIARYTHLNVLNPHMLSGHLQGRLLSMIARMIRPKKILEIGTYTGYSALCLAEGVQDKVVTVERNDELETTIRRHLNMSPFGEKVELHIGDAKTVIPGLEDEYELVFIDADKREYSTYLDLVFPRVPVGGWIMADNTLWAGHLTDSAYDKDKQTLGIRAFNERVAADPRLETLILPLRDGLTLMRKLQK